MAQPTLLSDFYKLSHRKQYPKGTEKVYSTWTPRSSVYAPYAKDGVIFFGLQYFIKEYLIDRFNKEFFSKPFDEIEKEYKEFLKYTLIDSNADVSHLKELHELGYLPIEIKAIDEGTKSSIRTPLLTIENTDKRFFWLTNYLETIMSATLWLPIQSATLAFNYRRVLDKSAMETVGDTSYVDFQAHDFSFRGMSSEQTAMVSGASHLTSFVGSDTIPAAFFLEKYYNANMKENLVMTSIPATEHSVMCSYGETNELELLRHLLTNVYPSGIFSAVCDTWDFWRLVSEYLPILKDEILNRDGKLVIRPDSGDPVKIICGDDSYPEGTPEYKGLIETLYDIFGGAVNSLGYKELDSHIGAIYGDSITLDRAKEITTKLKEKGFASNNIVLGVGSFSYQYSTRDSLGQAIKATYAVVNGGERKLFKDPKTDDGTKRSQRGLVSVYRNEETGETTFIDDLLSSDKELQDSILTTVFKDGELIKETSLEEIRERIKKQK